MRALALFLLGVAFLAIDQASKAWVRLTFAPGESHPLIDGLLHLTYVQNSGAAFGILQGRTELLVALTLALGVYALFRRAELRQAPWGMRLAYTLAISGAAGNLVDRIRLGWVTDFIDIRVWPVFNVADSQIVAGVILLGWYTLVRRPEGGVRGV